MKKLLIIIALILFGCGPQKVITTTTDKFESSIIHETETIKLGTSQNLVIQSPCDTILNKLREMQYSIVSGKTTVNVNTRGNQLSIDIKDPADTVKCKDSIVVKKEYIKEIVPGPVRIVPHYNKWFWIGWIGFLGSLIYIFRKYFLILLKLLIKFLKPI